MKSIFFVCCFLGYVVVNAQEFIPIPTPTQAAWQKAEIAVLISYDLHVFDNKRYQQGYNRIHPIEDRNIFYPKHLNTDQWIQSAKAGGAKVAILTVTHETGFALYQSKVNPYSMPSLTWKNGKGDLLRDFVTSCRKYNIEPGVYIGIRWNSYMGVHDFKVEGSSEFAANRQAYYNRYCEKMTEEILSNYGPLFFIWFDGGAHGPEMGGPDILPIAQRLQPNAIFYHNSQKADIRWGGSESGMVPYPCWSTYPFSYSHSKNQELIFKNDYKLLKEGDSAGRYYMPAMSDAPFRNQGGRHEWFWEPGDEESIAPVSVLQKMYYHSVGHNSTLILGLTPNADGLLPAQDADTLASFGKWLKTKFSKPLASASDSTTLLTLTLKERSSIHEIVLQEELKKGQRVRNFHLEAYDQGKWKILFTGSSIGNKYIHNIPEGLECEKIRLVVDGWIGEHPFTNMAVY